MENFILSSSSSSSSASPPSSSHISGAAFDDYSEDFCSICLEPFGVNDPSTITSCKHEYHLHCILEWSERSRECPICLQLLSLIDPSSQELLAAVEAEKCSRSRNIYPSSFTSSHIPHELLNYDYGDSYSDESDIDDQIMQHLVAASSRSRFLHRRERQRASSAGPSEVLVSNTPLRVAAMQPTLPTSPTGSSSPTSGVPSAVETQHPTSVFASVVEVARNTNAENDVPFKPRVLYTQPPSESGRRLNTPEMFSIPESFKSKFSAASARYKESITKSTRGLKEKLLAHNASVKELSKGVQREMNAGIAGVARMIERLDLSSKRSNSPPAPAGTGGSSGSPVKGKSVDEDDSDTVRSPSIYIENVVQNVSSDTPSVSSGMVVGRVVAGRVEIHHCVQSGNDAAVRI